MGKGIWCLDRGAALFIGMAAGAVLLAAFQADGRPLAGLLGANPVEAAAPPLPAPPPAASCVEHFPMAPQVIAALRANRPLRIGVFGDSFGDGISTAAAQDFRGQRDFAVYQFSHEATGFTRYQSLDLLKDAQAKLARQPVDIALISFGANDAQGVLVDGKAAPYMSKRWQALISDRAEALVTYLQARGIAVGWVGLPRMRKAQFDGDVQAMNAFYTGLMCKLHVPFVNPVAVSEDNAHHFAKELTDPDTKAPYLARADDGIHMSLHGYRVIARPLFERIKLLSPPGSASLGKEN